MIITTEVEYEIGQIVYLKTDTQQSPWIVCGYYVTKSTVSYMLCSGPDSTTTYDFEMSVDHDVLVDVS